MLTWTRRTPHVYYGHRAHSFCVADEAILTEIRARQRTFDGAAYRTAIGNLSYAIIVLKLFDRRFYRIGLLYTVLSILLFIMAYLRSISSRHDFADVNRPISNGSGRRVFGRAFTTAGWNVVAISLLVAVVEVVLFALVVNI
ncbi:hypothetical protein M422DRAFT_232931 [Sphaerobolus stellatus SS14]|uniref:Unplaced genomic scaffold SPHSTscaffold_113, whole genome shotgun sequence n=1 Tax=Sphaerobolus stellatus (strain SS14) TaxID=990650 RepID=A0A0C9VD62_SPHS4|nr:hypothetical protein M422DRAFT_782860 [Sphaerobolus stellatus SS14]KIJ35510.1 hypothetical protein M422DRAFT_232931 [Sphaerobolus stellatus SS14]